MLLALLLTLFADIPIPADQAQRAEADNNPCGSVHKNSGDFESRAMPSLAGQRDRVFTGTAPRVTSADSFESQQSSAERPVRLDGREKIFRTRWMKSASRARPAHGDQNGRERKLVSSDANANQSAHQAVRIEARPARRNHSASNCAEVACAADARAMVTIQIPSQISG